VSVASRPVEKLIAFVEGTGMDFRLEEPLARHTTMGVGGPAEIMVVPATTKNLLSVIQLAAELALPARVLGAGSNVLVGDEGVRGVVIQTAAMKAVDFGDRGYVEVEAGVHFPWLVKAVAAKGLRGLEGGVGIPGSLGGVVVMNAGAFGFSIGRRVERVTAISAGAGSVELGSDQLGFGYRSSLLGEDLVIVRCVLQLDVDEPRAVRVDMDRHWNMRKSTQPVGVKSAGCIFKNPQGESAGKIIDDLGLKGLTMGGARVSEVHANFIVHDGEARASDVLALIAEIKERVYRATSVELEEEVRCWT